MRARLATPFLAVAFVVVAACSGGQQRPVDLGPSQKTTVTKAVDTKVLAFAVSPDNLKVDTIGMHVGSLSPDGARDHVFTATVEGPVDAVYIAEVNPKGEPTYGFRASTVARNEEIPRELGGVVDTGAMTIGIGVVEKGRFVNGDTGGVNLPPGTHALALYAPNTGLLQPGDFLRLWVRSPTGGLAVGPAIPY